MLIGVSYLCHLNISFVITYYYNWVKKHASLASIGFGLETKLLFLRHTQTQNCILSGGLETQTWTCLNKLDSDLDLGLALDGLVTTLGT